MLIDITDSFDIPERHEALAKTHLLEKFEYLKSKGELREAAKLLEDSCEEPHIFHGHYKRLFIVWRQINKEDLSNRKYEIVIERVLKAIRLNDEMLIKMSQYWSEIHKKKRTKAYFAKSYSHIKVSDGKILKKAAEILHDKKSIRIADKLISSFEKQVLK